jgi:ATP-dependent Clp protease ATP-binding subunit ClpA
MYERFTSEARDAIMEAQTEARTLAHDHIGTEHLLLGVLRLPVRGDTRLPAHEPAGIAPRVLADLGVTLDRARAEVRRLVSRQEPGLTDADAEALRSIGIDVDEIRRRVEEDFGPGALDAPAGVTRRRRSADPAAVGPVFTSEAKHALELAVRESMKLGHRHIGAEHLLLAIAAPGGLSADILQSLGTDPAVVRTRVLEQLGRAA